MQAFPRDYLISQKSAETIRLRKMSSPGNQVEKLVFYAVQYC